MSNNAINFAGWILFVISAIGFIVSGLHSGDMAALTGAVFFLLACLVFMVPFFRRRRGPD